MKNHHNSSAQTPEELLQDLRTLISDAETLLGDSVKERSAEAVAALRSRFEAAQARVSAACETVGQKARAGARYADETIRENPYQSLAVAAGVGVLVGLLVGRNSK